MLKREICRAFLAAVVGVMAQLPIAFGQSCGQFSDVFQWHDPGSSSEDSVRALQVFDDGRGPSLFIGGAFRALGPSGYFGSVTCGPLVRWDGFRYSTINPQLGPNPQQQYRVGIVNCMTVFDDGSGPRLIVGGEFTVPSQGAANVASWDGHQWRIMGLPFSIGYQVTTVNSLAVWDEDGDGSNPPHLYATGNFERDASSVFNGIARWNGSSWEPVGGGLLLNGRFAAGYMG